MLVIRVFEVYIYVVVDIILNQGNKSFYFLSFLFLPFPTLSSQHIEDTSEIQELTKYKPHVLLTQENTQIKELQQENKGKNPLYSVDCMAGVLYLC